MNMATSYYYGNERPLDYKAVEVMSKQLSKIKTEQIRKSAPQVPPTPTEEPTKK